MSASNNPDSLPQGSEFHSKKPHSTPMETGGHKPGVLASERDRVPEFSAQTLPPGTAPASATYQPDPDLNNQRMYQSASETMQGSDSAAVHTGMGHPGQGQTSGQLRHDEKLRTKGHGLTGLAEDREQGQAESMRR